METTSIIRKIHRNARPTAGCEKHQRQPKPKRTTRYCGNGFLNYQFKPFTGFYVRDWQTAEQEFFASVSNICQFYSIRVPEGSVLPFPSNIKAVYKELSNSLRMGNNLSLKIMQDDTHDACLATAKVFDTDYRLYYIPIKPVCKLSASEDTKFLSKLLVTVYQYLYQVVGVDYYREPCYLNYTYETIENWINEDNDGEDEVYRKRQQAELQELKTFGDSFLHILKHPFCFNTLGQVFEDFKESAEWSIEAELLVQEIIKLITDYPNRSIRQSVPDDFYTKENDTICVEHYLSFFCGETNSFNDVLFDMINNDLQEMGCQEEPVAVQFFDEPQDSEQHNFDFEARLFAIINELIAFVNEYDNEEYQQ